MVMDNVQHRQHYTIRQCRYNSIQQRMGGGEDYYGSIQWTGINIGHRLYCLTQLGVYKLQS